MFSNIKCKIVTGVIVACVLLNNINLIFIYADTNTSVTNSYTGSSGSSGTNPSSTYNEGGSEGTPADEGERYNKATTTNPFLMPGNTWVTPEATYGQDCIVVLPIVNMFKYNITDIIVTPRLGAKTDDFPFEIGNTGYTQKVDVLVGEDAQPNYADRIKNLVWVFHTRENVKTGYYKLDFDITYTDPTCAVDTTVISVFVKCTGLPENGTIDGDGDKKLSMPRLIVTGFTTEPKDVYSGEQFTLYLSIENTSKETTVKNLQIDLTATVEGSTTQASYAAFLPTSGSNSVYVESISPGGETELTMDFEAKAGLEQKPYVMDINMQYEDERANAYESKGSVSIPVKQVSKFDISTPNVEPSAIDIGEQTDLMFSIYNTGKTTLYNVQVTVQDPSLQPALAYVGNLAPGATGNVDLMLTGAEYSTSADGMVNVDISYEDESGNVSSQSRQISVMVQQMSFGEDTSFEVDFEPEETGLQTWQKVLIGVGGGVAVLIVLIVIISLVRRAKRRREEDELASYIDDAVGATYEADTASKTSVSSDNTSKPDDAGNADDKE